MIPAAAASTLIVTEQVADLTTMVSRVDPEGARRLAEISVNLYSEPRLAAVREYVANAVDAVREGGSTAPVTITTPTLLEPNLVITDQGTGMSMAQVEAAFLAFAASTKRNTNDLIGGLGVGAKSAWALSESFLIDTVKDGRRTLVHASRSLTHRVLLAGEPTNLPNGTTISIPVEVEGHIQSWAQAVREVATAHDPGAVLVDGKAVTSIAAGPTRIGPVLCKRVRVGSGDTVMIRSGGTLFSSVPAVTTRVLRATKLNACVLELPIGSFDHTPSRESIVASDRTLAAVDAALVQFTGAFDQIKQSIDDLAATDVTAAVALRQSIVGDVASYEVLPINLDIEVPGTIGAWTFGRGYSRKRWSRNDGTTADTFTATSWKNQSSRTIAVTGVPRGRALRAFATFLADNHGELARVVPVPEGTDTVEFPVVTKDGNPTGQTFAFDATMVPESHRYEFTNWVEITKVKRAERSSVASGYSCVVIAQDGDKPVDAELSTAEIAAANLPVWYVEDSRPITHSSKGTVASIGVYLGRRKTGPLLASVPAAMTRFEWTALCHSTQTAGWTDIEKLAVATYAGYTNSRQRFAIAAEARDRILAGGGEPIALLDRIAEIHAAVARVTPAQEMIWETGHYNTDAVAKARNELSALERALTQAYPLLSGSAISDQSAYVEYVTAVPPRSV